MPTDKKKPAKVRSYYMRLPAELHQALVERASEHRRSLAQEILFLLESAIKQST